jgi:RNA polymerase sigma-70 factor (ECF subfamily)
MDVLGVETLPGRPVALGAVIAAEWAGRVLFRAPAAMTGKPPGNTDFDPARLIAAVAAGRDREAFVTLFSHYAPRVKAMLVRMGLAADRAEELAQDTLLTVWRKADSFDPARASASAWIFAIARNLRIDGLRRDRRAALYEIQEKVELEEPDRPDATLATAEGERRVRAALMQLPNDQMRAVELSFFQNRPHSDIAAALGIPLGTVKSRLRLAMGKLRQLLEDVR